MAWNGSLFGLPVGTKCDFQLQGDSPSMATNTTRAALLASIVAIGMGCGGGASDPPATGSIAGSLLRAAVSGVEIDLASHAGGQATVTNSAGHYDFADLPARSYVVCPRLS